MSNPTRNRGLVGEATSQKLIQNRPSTSGRLSSSEHSLKWLRTLSRVNTPLFWVTKIIITFGKGEVLKLTEAKRMNDGAAHLYILLTSILEVVVVPRC